MMRLNMPDKRPLKETLRLALDSANYRDAEQAFATLLREEFVSTLPLCDLNPAQKATLAAGLELADLHGLLKNRETHVVAAARDFVLQCEDELHPGSRDLGPARWGATRVFDAPRLRQRLRELSLQEQV